MDLFKSGSSIDPLERSSPTRGKFKELSWNNTWKRSVEVRTRSFRTSELAEYLV